MLQILFGFGVIVCTYLAIAPFMKPSELFEIRPDTIIAQYGSIVAISILASIIMVTLFSVVGGVVVLVCHSVYIFLATLDSIYGSWD